MLAVLAGPDDLPRRLAERYGVVIANDNAPGQVVLAGPVEELRDASADARRQGAKALWLDVASAFHSAAMAGAVAPFRAALVVVEFREPATPVFSSSTARPFQDVREELANAIVEPVRWRETMIALSRRGADTFIDFGPGQVLAGLARRNLPDAETIDASTLEARASPITSDVR